MKILYLSYWSLGEGLTQSSVIPHLKVLAEKPYISEIHFLTVERENDVPGILPEFDKLSYYPLHSSNLRIGVLNKFNDFRIFSKQIIDIVKNHEIESMICRGALAGALGYLAYDRTAIPYIVESFEPHAEYMLDGKIWNKRGLKYKMQNRWEHKIMQTAQAVVTVSKHYTTHIQSKCEGKVLEFGCAVDLEKFQFTEIDREKTRKRLGFEKNTIGVYVGKFGSIYYDKKAFMIIKRAFELIADFRLILLTPEDRSVVLSKIQEFNIDLDQCFVNRVPHHEVPAYLSAADFAFSMVRPSPIRLFCSPIKDGEYWANGLPILSADQIGEDSDIIRLEDVGAIFKDDLSDLDDSIHRVLDLINQNRLDNNMTRTAKKYRSFELLPAIYDQLLSGSNQ